MDMDAFLNLHPLAALALAFGAGIASSASPCTIAAVPLVVGYTGGYAGAQRWRAVQYAAAFVLGLAVSFTLLGLAAALAGALLLPASPFWRGLLALAAIAAGTSLLLGLRLPRLPACSTPIRPMLRGLIGAALAGALSGIVFSPCATPVLVGILALVGSQQDVVFGSLLMFLYSLGHGALLLVAGSSVGLAQWLARSKGTKILHDIFARVAGAVLTIYGLWIAAGISGLLDGGM